MENKDIINIAFDKMLLSSELALSSKGAESIKTLYDGAENDKWTIVSICVDGTLEIVSETHYVFKGLSLDHFEWNK